jgi:uncharacterized membrane protein YdbT with pleckstrin-like domain
MESGIERANDDRNLKHNRGSPNANSGSLEKLPFELQNGEKIIRELKPQFFGFMMTRTFGAYVVLLCLVVVIMVALMLLRIGTAGALVELLVLPLVVLFLILAIGLKPLIQYGKSWYWITNLRVIGKRGFLGYSIDSIPLENVGDIVLARTLLDRFLGLSSLIIVPIGSTTRVEGEGGNMVENPNFFPALTQETARELQRRLLNLRDDLKKHDRASSMVGTAKQPAAASAEPYRSRKGSTQESIQPRRSGSAAAKPNAQAGGEIS